MQDKRGQLYSSKILKSGALIAETKVLLANWDLLKNTRENLDRFKRDNLLGKSSRSRIDDILGIFKQRYLIDDQLLRSLIILARNRYPIEGFDKILFFYAARADALMHDFVSEKLKNMHDSGIQEVKVNDAELWIRRKIDEGKTHSAWSEKTITKSAQGLMSTLRDYGVLQGIKNKRFATIYLPVDAFSFIAFYMSKRQPSGERLIQDPEWRLFFLDSRAVEHLFMEAHQLHLLTYQAAGSVIRITFPSDTIEEYANVILERMS